MTKGMTVQLQFHAKRGWSYRTQVRAGAADTPALERIPRISRLMALAIRLDQLIQQGVVSDQAELSRIGRVSRARITQIMNLLNLAPDIQEQVLLGTGSCVGRDAVTERTLRPFLAQHNWRTQRQLWLRTTKSGPTAP